MMRVNGLPVEQTDRGNLLAYRSRWNIGSNEVAPFPGDRIAWSPALGTPRYIEHLTQFTEGVEEQPLVVHAIDPSDPVLPCTYCSHEQGVAQRGIIDSDYELRTEDGQIVAYTCFSCISDAPKPEDEYDLEAGTTVQYDEKTGNVIEVYKDLGRALIDFPDEANDWNVRIERLQVLDGGAS